MIDDLWTQYTLISIKTNNDIEKLERMDFWKFRALSKKLGEYLETENGANNGNNGEAGNQNNPMGSVNQMMSSSKNMMKNATPNFKSFK